MNSVAYSMIAAIVFPAFTYFLIQKSNKGQYDE